MIPACRTCDKIQELIHLKILKFYLAFSLAKEYTLQKIDIINYKNRKELLPMESPRGKITLHDIAAEVGLSITSVSLVLNNRENRISPDKRQEILEVAARLGYLTPSRRRKKAGRDTRSIGLMIPDVSGRFFSSLVQGALDYAGEQDAILSVISGKSEEIFTKNRIDSFVASGISALIIVPPDNCQADAFADVPIPVIQADRYSYALPFSSVRLNHRKGGYLAGQHLAECGHRRVACITGPSEYVTTKERTEGFRLGLEAAGITLADTALFSGDYEIESGFQLGDRIFAGGYSAVFCENDLMAIGLVQRLLQLGKRAGDDISVIGFDDISVSRMIDPPLTTVRQSAHDIGYAACQRAFEEMSDPSLPKQTVFFEPELIVRKSTNTFEPRGVYA